MDCGLLPCLNQQDYLETIGPLTDENPAGILPSSAGCSMGGSDPHSLSVAATVHVTDYGAAPDLHASRRKGPRSQSTMRDTDIVDAYADRDLLMKLLSKCMPLVKAAEATERLLERYESYADAVVAPLAELQAIPSLGEHGATLLKCVHASAVRLASVSLRRTRTISDWHNLRAYLNISMARERNEVFRVLFLDTRNHLIADQVLAEGSACSVPVSIRDVVQRSLQLGATAILLIHNHPSGNPTPSEDDLHTTQKIESAVTMLGIRLHDHVIVGRGMFFSCKEMKFRRGLSPAQIGEAHRLHFGVQSGWRAQGSGPGRRQAIR